MNKQQLIINGGIFVAGAGLGYGAGYLVYKKKYERIAEEEIESVRKAYSKNAKPKPDLSDLVQNVKNVPVETAESIMADNGYNSEASETDADTFRRSTGRVPTIQELIQMGEGVPVESVVRNAADHDDDNVQEVDLLNDNLFDNPPEQDPEDADDDGVMQMPPRDPNKPYVIETADWYLNETNYDQITLVYWADDAVLVGDNRQIIHDIANYVGIINLHRFGFASDNPDVVYVRNEQLKTDFEITKDERSYAEVVLHISPEEDATHGAPRRMRNDDE